MHKYVLLSLMFVSSYSFTSSLYYESKKGRLVMMVLPCHVKHASLNLSDMKHEVLQRIEQGPECLCFFIDKNKQNEHEALVTVVGPHEESVQRLTEKVEDLFARTLKHGISRS